MHIRKNDKVVVISGENKSVLRDTKDQKAVVREVLKVYPKKDMVLVKGVNMVTKHQKQTRADQKAGIIKVEAPIHVSKVMLWNDKIKSAVRVGYKIDENGAKVRVCKKTGEII